ncbi:DUF58 domain-containing protein [uncultured Pelagimonas sp.]|uniref:DUF58 domain-containing protein n=1 Tax=uncultured Pelagimonas sp. TaxID=1618102 RepID=UPI002629CDCF|nr:DUF58 domain-containing protein [uncultured Pelagimonas sp.]
MADKADRGQGKHDPRIHADLHQLQRLAGRAESFSLLPHQPSHSVLNGQHSSKLRGRGLDFEELRDYHNGDDIRTIDWKVTARTGSPYVRVYTEERDRPALLIVDQRMSMFFGSQVYMKSVVAAEAAALAAHRMLAQGDRVGGLVFDDNGIAEHRPARTPAAVQRFLGSVADANCRLNPATQLSAPGSLNKVLTAANRIAKTNYLVMIFSDFDTADAETEPLISSLAMSNDVLLFPVSDALSKRTPDGFRIVASDGALQVELDTTDMQVKQRIDTLFADRFAQIANWSRKYGLPLLPLTTDASALDQIKRLLGQLEGPR